MHHDSIPDVDIIDAIRPSVASRSATRLMYPHLAAAVRRHEPFQAARKARLLAATPGSLEHEQAERQLLRFDLLRTALKLQQADDRVSQKKLSLKFTELSTKIFGKPDPESARALIANSIARFMAYAKQPGADAALAGRLIDFYAAHSGAVSPEKYDLSPDLKASAELVHDYLWSHYGEALEAVQCTDDEELDAEAVAARFRAAMAILKRDNPAWEGWQVVLRAGGTMAVKAEEKLVLIGELRAKLDCQSLPAVFGHEVLVHALRSVNACTQGKRDMIKGLPGYLYAEEGLACFIEFALTGFVPGRLADRYIDISFALGLLDNHPVPRRELYHMAVDRKRLNVQVGKRSASHKDVWEHINRIYRGTLGNDVVGVFAKDIVYYEGFRMMSHYIAEQLKQQTVDELMAYLCAGKFNPLDERHTAYIQGDSFMAVSM